MDRFRGCCEFSMFIDGFLASARRHKVPLALINRMKARKDWRQGMTGNEALLMQRSKLLFESEYALLQQPTTSDQS